MWRNVDFVNESESVMFPSKKLLQNAYDYGLFITGLSIRQVRADDVSFLEQQK